MNETLAELEEQRREISNAHIWANAMTRGGARPRPPDTSELDAKISAAKEAAGKAFWQRTQKQVLAVLGMPAAKHRQYVEAALKAGKSVPPRVLQDYPDLQGATV